MFTLDPELFAEGHQPSVVERLFENPERMSAGEYTTIYEFLLSPDIRDDPDLIKGVLEEFIGWARYMLEQLQKSGELEINPNLLI